RDSASSSSRPAPAGSRSWEARRTGAARRCWTGGSAGSWIRTTRTRSRRPSWRRSGRRSACPPSSRTSPARTSRHARPRSRARSRTRRTGSPHARARSPRAPASRPRSRGLPSRSGPMSADPHAAVPELLVIEAGHTERHYWRDLWRYRELFYFLAWRDILVRYKQTAIGIAWAVLRPVLTMAVFTVVFGKLGKFPSEGVPYPILVYAAMLPWQFFARAPADASASLVGNANLISKVYFPRLIVPASAVITSF